MSIIIGQHEIYNMVDKEKIYGETILKWTDNLFSDGITVACAFAFLFLAAPTDLGLWISDFQILMHNSPAAAMQQVLFHFWPLWPIIMTIGTLFWQVKNRYAFRRFPNGQRRIAYEADEASLHVNDDASPKLTLAWSAVEKIRSTDRRLALKPRGGRAVVVRLSAFTPANRRRLLSLVEKACKPQASSGGIEAPV